MTIFSIAISLINILFYLILPAFIIVQIWRNRSVDFLKWLLLVFSGGCYIVSLFYLGACSVVFVGYYLRYILLFLFILSSVKSFFDIKRVFLPFKKNQILTVILHSSFCVFQIWRISVVFSSSFYVPQGMHLSFPLKNGEYCILQGGNNSIMNHHFEVDAQKYAIDIVKINKLGIRYKNLFTSDLMNYNIFGDIIYSPCNGKIAELADGASDLEPGVMDPEHPAGNHLIIEMEDSQSAVVLAHIMNGSFLVKNGDTIKEGQPLARIGNSGNTSEPHLHMHVVSRLSGDLIFTGDGIPMRFNNRFLVRNDRIHSSLLH